MIARRSWGRRSLIRPAPGKPPLSRSRPPAPPRRRQHIAAPRAGLEASVAEHLRFVRDATESGARLVVFPELSLTGYELTAARSEQLDPEDAALQPLADAASRENVHVIVGAPLASRGEKPRLASFLYTPDAIVCYEKIHVHETERPYFDCGTDPCVVSADGARTGLAICADSGVPQHPADASALGAELYVSSVMEIDDGYEGHAGRLGEYARQFGMAVVMANHAGVTGACARPARARSGMSVGRSWLAHRRTSRHW